MNTPTLDENLRNILHNWASGEFPDMDVIAEVHAAYKEAGYMRCTEVTALDDETRLHAHWLEDDGKSYNIRPHLPNLMSGREWYDRMIKEVDHEKVFWEGNASREYIVALIGNTYLAAARRASGIEEKAE